MKAINAHRALGLILIVFIVAHLGNHMALFWGVKQHLAVQEILRQVYRNPVFEFLLLLGFATQLFLGMKILLKRGWPQRFWPRLQLLSGVAIVFFLIQHIGAVLYTRVFWPSIDTNIYWAASVVSGFPFALYFIPYYIIGFAALFAHIAAFIALRKQRRKLASLIVVFGAVLSATFVAALSGVFYSIDLPPPYISYLANLD